MTLVTDNDPTQWLSRDMATLNSGKDADILFPHFTVLKASAGSGKTHALTERFVQFILSDKIPRSNLRNILALTFSNNAAKEMRGRILAWLKEICFGEPDKCAHLSQLLIFRQGASHPQGRDFPSPSFLVRVCCDA